MYRILMVDDEADLLEVRSTFLQNKGCVVDTAQSPIEAINLLPDHVYDLILLDVKMPTINGFDLCKNIIYLHAAPIIFLSSMSDEDDQLKGFDVGCADYITKDCPLELFWAKLRACMQRFRQSTNQSIRKFPPLFIDLRQRQVLLNGEKLALTNIEFALLERLSASPKQLCTIEQLYRFHWGGNGEVDNQLVQVHLSHLRQKMQKAFPRHDFLETIWGKGYQFVPLNDE